MWRRKFLRRVLALRLGLNARFDGPKQSQIIVSGRNLHSGMLRVYTPGVSMVALMLFDFAGQDSVGCRSVVGRAQAVLNDHGPGASPY
jgi:hypothetical protein